MKLYIFSFVFLAVSGRSRTDRYDPIDETAGSFNYNITKLINFDFCLKF